MFAFVPVEGGFLMELLSSLIIEALEREREQVSSESMYLVPSPCQARYPLHAKMF